MIIFRGKYFSRFKTFRKRYLENKRAENIASISTKNSGEIKRVKELLKSDWENYEPFLKKVYESFIDFEQDMISKYTSEDPITTIHYIKPVRKQGVDEDAQFKYIESEFSEVVGSGNIVRVKKSANMYFVNNKIVFEPKSVIKNTYKSLAKSIDLKITYSFLGKTFLGLGTLKHTQGRGGSQDNQFTDIENTNIEFIKSTDKNLYTFSILSGDYYKSSKFKYLIRTYKTDRNKIVSVDKFGYVLVCCILDWLTKTIKPEQLSDKKKEELDTEISRLLSLKIKYRLEMSTYDEKNY